jgi:anaerobic magnesium-protoporphyrin IX monomethyl ester cyclase
MKQRVILINLPYFRLMKVRHRYFPVGLGSIAACVKEAGHAVTIYDMEKDRDERSFKTALTGCNKVESFHSFTDALCGTHILWQELMSVVKDFQPTVIGISIWTTVYPFAKKIVQMIKDYDQDITLVAGGIHATVCDEDVLQRGTFDYVVRGEGEIVFCDLLDSLSEGTDPCAVRGISMLRNDIFIRVPDQELIADLDQIPVSARDAVLYPHLYTEREYGCIVASRGCPFRCSFCSSHMIWKRDVRERSIDAVYAEIKEIHETFGVSFFTFFDDTFTLKQERINDLCSRIRKDRLPIRWFAHGRIDSVDEVFIESMKKGRLFVMQFGIESGSQTFLDSLQKEIQLTRALEIRRIFKEKRLLFWATFLIGHPGETEEDLAKTAYFLEELKPDLVNINTYIPYPGSDKWKDYFQDVENIPWQRFSPQSPYANFTQIADKQWHYWRSHIESKADQFNRKTQRSVRAYFSLTIPKIFSRMRSVVCG